MLRRAGAKSEGGLDEALVCVYTCLIVFVIFCVYLFCWSGPFGSRSVPDDHHSLSVLRVSWCNGLWHAHCSAFAFIWKAVETQAKRNVGAIVDLRASCQRQMIPQAACCPAAVAEPWRILLSIQRCVAMTGIQDRHGQWNLMTPLIIIRTRIPQLSGTWVGFFPQPLLKAPQSHGLPLPQPPLGGSSLRDLFTHFRSLAELTPKWCEDHWRQV